MNWREHGNCGFRIHMVLSKSPFHAGISSALPSLVSLRVRSIKGGGPETAPDAPAGADAVSVVDGSVVVKFRAERAREPRVVVVDLEHAAQRLGDVG